MYLGIAGNLATDKSTLEVGLSIHDATYSIDFSVKHLHFPNNEPNAKAIADFILNTIMDFSRGTSTRSDLSAVALPVILALFPFREWPLN